MKCEFDILETLGLKDYICKYISNSFFGYVRNVKADITCNDIKINLNDTVNKGSHVVINYTPIVQQGNMSDKPLKIVYEDEYCLVVDKPSGICCIPSRLHQDDTIFNRLKYYFKDSEITLHFISRLDKDTSGLVLICKNQYAAALFSQVMEKFIKEYQVETYHPLPKNEDIINLPIERINGIKRGVKETGKMAKTKYQFISEDNGVYRYLVRLYTGLTHQIRVHFAYLGSPIINDAIYGDGKVDGPLHLHACYLKFYHPFKKKWIEINSIPNFANK